MSRHTSDAKQRKSRKYRELHQRLRAETTLSPEPSKQERRQARSANYRQHGGE